MVAPVRTRDEFAALARSRARGRSGPLRVTRAPLPEDHDGRRRREPRVAYAVPKRVGTAVVRNRVRRRLRAVIDQLGPDDGLTPALYLVGVQPEAVSLPAADLRRHLVAAVQATAPVRTGS